MSDIAAAAAAGQIRGPATIVGVNGKAITSLGQAAQAVSYLRHPFTGLQIVAGRPPRGPTEVAIDESTAEREHFRIGDTVPVVTAHPEHTFTISGIVRYAGAALGGGPLAVFSLPIARALYGRLGKVDLIYVALAHGASTTATTAAIRRAELLARRPQRGGSGRCRAPERHEQAHLGHRRTARVRDRGGAAGAFAVFNALSIAISQRSREFALLRALGSTRRQLVAAVVAEATVLGLIGSVIGLGVGFGIAAAIRAVFSAAGQDLPSADLVLSVRTVLVGLGGGVAISVAAGLLPAWHATRVAPLEALRTAEPAPLERRGWRRGTRLGVPAVLAAAGVGVAFGLRGSTANSRRRGDRRRGDAAGGGDRARPRAGRELLRHRLATA